MFQQSIIKIQTFSKNVVLGGIQVDFNFPGRALNFVGIPAKKQSMVPLFFFNFPGLKGSKVFKGL